MNTVRFKDTDRGQSLLGVAAYLIVLGAVLFGVVGIDRAADFVNGFGSAKVLGLLVGFAALTPVVFIMAMATRTIEAEFGADALTVKAGKREPERMSYDAIGSVDFGKSAISTFTIRDAGGRTLRTFRPLNDAPGQKALLKAFGRIPGLRKTETSRGVAGGSLTVVEFTRP